MFEAVYSAGDEYEGIRVVPAQQELRALRDELIAAGYRPTTGDAMGGMRSPWRTRWALPNTGREITIRRA